MQLIWRRISGSSNSARSDRTNRLDDPKEQTAPKKKRGRQPGSAAPKRRDYSHLPARIQEVDVPDDAKVCACSGLPQTVTAALPPKLLPKSIYGTSMWVHLLLEKFQRQRPMHRIISQLQLFGLFSQKKQAKKDMCGGSGYSLATTRLCMCSTRLAATMCRNRISAKRSQECWSSIATVRTKQCSKSSWANFCSRSAGLMCGVTLCGSARAFRN